MNTFSYKQYIDCGSYEMVYGIEFTCICAGLSVHICNKK